MLSDEQLKKKKEIEEKRRRGEQLTAEDESFLGLNSKSTYLEALQLCPVGRANMRPLTKLSELPSPWRDFLLEHDADLPMQVRFVLIGAFVFKFLYGLPRPTQDIDFYTMEPRFRDYSRRAGRRSDLGKKYGVYLHGAGHTEMPRNYESRLTEVLAGEFKHLRLFVPDKYDLVLSKLKRNSIKDQEDVIYLFKREALDISALSRRYDEELKDCSSEQTIRLWITMFQSLIAHSSSQAS